VELAVDHVSSLSLAMTVVARVTAEFTELSRLQEFEPLLANKAKCTLF